MASPSDIPPTEPAATTHRRERKRAFVREVAGKYSELYRQLFEGPRTFSSADVQYRGGPQHFHKDIVSPEVDDAVPWLHSHLDIFVPGARSQKHAHMNSAVFYILEGRGYDIHDGRRLPWKAGDVIIVEPGCVHQHFNDSDTEFARVLVLKAKPLFMFADLIFQTNIEPHASEIIPGFEQVSPDMIDPFTAGVSHARA